MSNYRLRARSSTPGDYNFIAGRLAFLPAVTNVKSGIDRGDGTLGTYDPITGQYTDPGKANVLIGSDYVFAGVAQVAELDFNEAARNTDPGVANVWNGITYKILNVAKTGTKRASSITNCSAGNIKSGVTIDDVLGTYAAAISGDVEISGSGLRAVFAESLPDIFIAAAENATYTPLGGTTINCKIFIDFNVMLQPSGIETQVWERGTTIEVSLSSYAGVGIGTAEPNRGDTFVYEEVTYTVQAILENDGLTVKMAVK